MLYRSNIYRSRSVFRLELNTGASLIMLSVFREIFAPRFLTSIPGAVFWFGKLCLVCAVWFAYVLARGCREDEQSTLPVVDTSELTDASATATRNALESYSAIANSAVFAKPKLAPVAAATPPPASPLKLRLVGVSELSTGNRLAIIEDSQKQAQEVFELNSDVFGQAKLVDIQVDRVQLSRNGKLEMLETQDGAEGGGTGPSDEGEEKTEFTVPEEEVTQALANLPQLLSQARAVPYFRNGQSIGMRLFAIRTGSLYEKLGLKNGDIVTAVNDSSLSDPTQALKLFEQLKSQRQIAVKLERNGESVDLKYSIR